MVGLMRVKMMEKAEQVCKYAEILRRKKQFFKAILYFQIAQTISDRNIKNPLKVFRISLTCIRGIGICISNLFIADCRRICLLINHVMPWMYKSYLLAAKVCNFEKVSAMILAMVYMHEAEIYCVLDDNARAEVSFKKAMSAIEKHHKTEAENYLVYGVSLFCLGLLYLKAANFAGAKTYFKRSFVSLEKAKDETAEAKAKLIPLIKKIINDVDRRMTRAVPCTSCSHNN